MDRSFQPLPCVRARDSNIRVAYLQRAFVLDKDREGNLSLPWAARRGMVDEKPEAGTNFT